MVSPVIRKFVTVAAAGAEIAASSSEKMKTPSPMTTREVIEYPPVAIDPSAPADVGRDERSRQTAAPPAAVGRDGRQRRPAAPHAGQGSRDARVSRQS